MTWIVVSVIINGSSYSYKVVNNNCIYSKLIKKKNTIITNITTGNKLSF